MRTVTYQSSRQSSNHVKVHSGNAVRNYKSRYGKGIRPTYTVLQIKADSPVNGADVFWYEGNCSILGSKNVYIGYNDNSMSVVSQFELVMTIISGAFLLFHTVSARLLSKKNPYGGKLFWFFKFSELENMLQSDKELFMKKKVPVFYSPKDVNRCIVYLEDSQ